MKELLDWYCSFCNASIFPGNFIDEDDQFRENIYNLFSNNSLSFDQINNMVFNPFSFNENEKIPFFDLDPDLNLFIETSFVNTKPSDYYTEDSFVDTFVKGNKSRHLLSWLHWNTRSIPRHHLEIEATLDMLDFPFTFICAAETWFTSNNHFLYSLDNYHCADNVFRTTRSGGGVSIYVSKAIPFIRRKEFYRCTDVLECMFIEIDKSYINTRKNVIVGELYRPPNTSISEYQKALNEILISIRKENKVCYICCDNNIDLLKTEQHSGTSDCVDDMYSNMFIPLINKPTRVTETTATLIDNIWCNDVFNTKDFSSGIIFNTTSDHFPIFHILHDVSIPTKNEYIIKRKFTSENENKFLDELSKINWEELYQKKNAQHAYDVFHNHICSLFNECFPKEHVKIGYKTRKLFLSNELKSLIKEKNKLSKKCLKIPILRNKLEYQDLKKKVDHDLDQAEKKYYQYLFEKYTGNLKKSWQLIRRIINKNKSGPVQSLFIHNGKEVTNPKEISEHFNKFYVNVGPTLASKIPESNKSPADYLKGDYTCSFHATPVTDAEMELIINSLKDSASGWDELSAMIIKAAKEHIISPLVFICNLSLKTSCFPDQLKIAKVIPLYKADDPRTFSNYRPVSVLPVISKILERIMYNRLIEYLDKNNILYAKQFGFRKSHSSVMALMLLVDKISRALEEGEFAIGIFIDFSKAFDTINFNILFNKLYHYGIRGSELNWFISYLSNRKQFVNYNGQCSSYGNIVCGVPQGSILGPLLFLIYVNDLAYVSDYLYMIMFADDTNALDSDKNLNALEERCNNEMIKIVDWVNANKLSLNVKKTNYMLFSGKKAHGNEQGIIISQKRIEKTNKAKFLGIMISDNLSWKCHIEYISKKVAKSVGVLSRLSKFLYKKSLLNLYYSLVYPYLIYCNEVWGLSYSAHRKKLFSLQKRALRIICGKKKYYKETDTLTRSEPLFKELKVMKMHDVTSYLIVTFLFKFYHKKLPTIFDSMFRFNANIHDHFTRQSIELHVPIVKRTLTKMTVRYAGVILWNSFSKKLSLECTIDTFKKNLKLCIIDAYRYDI